MSAIFKELEESKNTKPKQHTNHVPEENTSIHLQDKY